MSRPRTTLWPGVPSRFVFLAVLWLTLASTTQVEAAVALWPTEIQLASAPGETAIARLNLWNRSSSAQDVYVDFTDWDVEEDRRILVPAGTSSRSLFPFVTVDPPVPFIRLEAGEHRPVTVRVLRPSADEGTRWVALRVTSRPLGEPPPRPDAPRLMRRQQARLYHTPLPLTPARGEIRRIARRPDDTGNLWQVEWDNVTDRVYSVGGRWRLSDAYGDDVATGVLLPFLSYPGRRRAMVGPLPQLSTGTYHLLVVLTPHGGEPTAGQLVLRVMEERDTPWP